MRQSRKITQITLILIALLLIFSTYFFYPKFQESKLTKRDSIIKEEEIQTEKGAKNSFEKVEYKGLYDFDNPFTVKSEKAFILDESPDLVYMTKMQVILQMDDGRIVIISSDRGKYNKVTYDCYFEENVKATDGETTISAINLDLLATEDLANVYNSVVVSSDRGSLKADRVEYDFKTKYYHVSMFNSDKVKIKLVEWVI